MVTENRSVMILYEFTDRAFSEPFLVKASANAWWNDIGKVRTLVQCFKMNYSIKEACILAGISRDQYYYFVQQHPDFSDKKERLQMIPGIRAWDIIIGRIRDGDVKAAWWYINRYDKIEEAVAEKSAYCLRCGDLIKKEAHLQNMEEQKRQEEVVDRILKRVREEGGGLNPR